jgi:hypothetical protein
MQGKKVALVTGSILREKAFVTANTLKAGSI